MLCINCLKESRKVYLSRIDNRPMCLCCARAEVEHYLHDADPDSLGKLRRRAEDLLRKDDTTARAVIADLAARGKIKWVDCL